MKHYAERDSQDLEPHFSKHMDAMTSEGLWEKSAVAAELAARDKRIAALTEMVQRLARYVEQPHPPAKWTLQHEAAALLAGGL